MSDDDKQGNIASRFADVTTDKRKSSKLDVDQKYNESFWKRSKNQFRRMSSDLDFTGILTKFPVITVILCLVVTAFFAGVGAYGYRKVIIKSEC